MFSLLLFLLFCFIYIFIIIIIIVVVVVVVVSFIVIIIIVLLPVRYFGAMIMYSFRFCILFGFRIVLDYDLVM